MKRQIEVLAPAGSVDCLKAAILNGADAVYLGGEMFGARAYAGNFNQQELCEAIDYAHCFGVKIFLTINTLVKEKELDALVDFLKPYYEQGLDAVIVQDLGVLAVVREHFPDLEIHASTQMTITGIHGARMAKKMGAKRVVPARELSLKEIREIKNDTGLDMECFVHGALCYCYSGQCFMSSMLGGRSGNRGRCAGTCRLPFSLKGQKKNKNSYPLSLKDLCTIEQLPQILDQGVDSLKIEGRMKGARYVGEVTRIYRKYVDLYLSPKPYQVEENDKKILMELFNRGGFTDGYYTQYHGKQMMSMKRPNHQGILMGRIEMIKKGTVSFTSGEDISKGDILEIEISASEKVELTSPSDWKRGSLVTLNGQKMKKLYPGMNVYRIRNQKLTDRIDERLKEKKKENLKGKIILRAKECAKLWIDNGCDSVWTKGPVIEKAKKQGADRKQIMKQLSKTGETHYQFQEIQVEMDENIFVPGSVLKKLRREAFAALDQKKTEKYRRNYHAPVYENTEEQEMQAQEDLEFTVSLENLELLPNVLKVSEIQNVYISWMELKQQKYPEDVLCRIKNAGKRCYLILPQIARKRQIQELEVQKYLLFSEQLDGLVVRNLEEFFWLVQKNYQKELVLDYMMYQYNKKAVQEYRRMYDGKLRMTYSIECNRRELAELDLQNADLLFYGYLPLMVSAQCVKNNLQGCNRKEEWMTLTDRYQKKFFIKTCCSSCVNEIYNGQPIWLGKEADLKKDLHPKVYRFHFTKETPEEADQILRAVKELRKGKNTDPVKDFTKGHMNRGIL